MIAANALRISLLTLLASACGVPVSADCRVELQAVLPIILDDFMPTIEAAIDGQAVRFGIDTGAQGTVLTPETVENFRLARDSRHFTTAIGIAGRMLVSNAILAEFTFAGEIHRDKSVAVIAIGQPHGKGAAGPPMAGIIGAELLSHYDVDMDIPHLALSLYRVEDCLRVTPQWGEAGYMTLPVTLARSGRPVVPVEVDGRPVTAIFDSGARTTLLSPSSGGTAGNTTTLFIGDETLPPAQLGRVDFPLGEADMLIGEDYMRRHRFWLSYATRTLFIQR